MVCRFLGKGLYYCPLSMMKLPDLLPVASAQLPLHPLLPMLCSLAVIVLAVIQFGKSSDDDGPGDGGLMQPVGAGA